MNFITGSLSLNILQPVKNRWLSEGVYTIQSELILHLILESTCMASPCWEVFEVSAESALHVFE